MERLRKRSEYLAVAAGRRVNRPAFTLQILARPSPPPADAAAPGGWRFGFTVTRQLGGAVVRNRIRRRLKEAVRLVAAQSAPDGLAMGLPPADIVVVGRAPALTLPFSELRSAMAGGLAQAAKLLADPDAKPSAGRPLHRRRNDGHG